MPAYPSCPGNEAIKWVSVYLLACFLPQFLDVQMLFLFFCHDILEWGK